MFGKRKKDRVGTILISTLVNIFLNTIMYNILFSPQSRKARKESFFYCFPLRGRIDFYLPSSQQQIKKFLTLRALRLE
jgi:hypothetical protein